MRADADSAAYIGNAEIAGAGIEPRDFVLNSGSDRAARAVVALHLHPGQISKRSEAGQPAGQKGELLAVINLKTLDLRFAAVLLRGQRVPGVIAVETVIRPGVDGHPT